MLCNTQIWTMILDFSNFQHGQRTPSWFEKSLRLNDKMDIIIEFYIQEIAILHILHKSELYFWIFQIFNMAGGGILIWKNSMRLNGKMDITNEFYTPKIAILHVSHKSEPWFWNFQIFNMADSRHLVFWKSLHGDN